MFGTAAKMDLVRLAIPRRVYTQSHIDYVVEVILEVWKNRNSIRGLKLAISGAVSSALHGKAGAGELYRLAIC